MKHLLIFISLIILQFKILSQNQNPPDLLWKSIKSENFEVVFPIETETEAQRIANTLELMYLWNTKSLDVKPKPISIILYNQSNKSNAYAALAPRRMGWYLTPPQTVTNLGSVDWIQTLAIHEYRHVVQYAKNKQHFTKFVSYLFGDIGHSMMQWSIPDWFFEGDAILMETALTNGGRGRLPSFSMYIRTYSLSDEKFTYDQAYLGSYKRFYPSHYHLGYPLTAFGRSNFGKEIWDNVLERTSKISFWPYAFGSSVKKYTGLNTNKFYKNAINDFSDSWKLQSSNNELTDIRVINTKKKKKWTNCFNPQYDKDGNVIYGKESLDKIAAFYQITPEGKEKKLKNTDAGIFNLSSEKILWARTIPDIRWGEKAFTDIILFDIQTKIEKRLSNKSKYLSPALSPNGKLIAAVDFSEKQDCYLVIIDVESGSEIKRFKIGQNEYIRTPVWSADGTFLAFTNTKFNGPALTVMELANGNLKTIEAASWENIGKPVFYENYIIYNSDYSGIGNIYATNMSSGQRYQITSRPYGAYNAAISPDKTKMLFQDYTKTGFDIAEIDLNPNNWKKIEEVKQTIEQYYKPLVEQEGNLIISQYEIKDSIYAVEKYKKSKDAINIHSWGIYPYVPDLEVSVTSNNYLNTLGASVGYLYNTNEKTNTGFLSLNYSRFFPVFGLYSSYGEREGTYNLSGNQGIYTDKWKELNTRLSINLPFNLSRGVYNSNLSVRAAYGYTFTKEKEVTSITLKPNGVFTTATGSISYSRFQQYAYRDFAPRWGQYFSTSFTQIPQYNEKEGYLFSGQAGFYFPGLFAQNSIKLSGGYEKQLKYDASDRSNSYYFSSLISLPRGYGSDIHDEFYKFSADYQFPLWYPDISIGPLVYIKRIRAGFFYDYAKGFLGEFIDEYQSVGGSVLFEFNLFRINYPFEIGVQFAHRLTNGKNQISMLILGLPF